jgi:hypothetical protein
MDMLMPSVIWGPGGTKAAGAHYDLLGKRYWCYIYIVLFTYIVAYSHSYPDVFWWDGLPRELLAVCKVRMRI